jgi:hypothetical protein
MRRRSYRRRRNSDPIDDLLGSTISAESVTTPTPIIKRSQTEESLEDDLLDDLEEVSEDLNDDLEEVSEDLDDDLEESSEDLVEETPGIKRAPIRQRKKCNSDSPFEEARERLKYQTEAFFSQDLSEKKKSQFQNYYPYLELKSRTLPIPSLEEYQIAMDLDTKVSIKDAYGQFEDTIILFMRKNGNTQIIFPGKSTTSYTMRGYGYKELLWTPSVEFMTYSYESILDATLGSGTREEFGKQITFNSQNGTAFVGAGQRSRIEIDLTFCNSLEAAKSWLDTIWINAKTSRLQKKYEYECLFFQETGSPQKGNPNVAMKYLGKVKLFPSKKSETPNIISDKEVSEVFPGIETKSNPQRRLPNKSKKDRKFRRRRSRHRL